MFKVHPPLRTDADVEAIREGLADGTIDAIATDHAPHTPEAKERPFEEAPPGMLGLETALALTLTELVEPGHPRRSRTALGAALVAARGHRRSRRPGRRRSSRAAPPTSRCSTPRTSWEVDADAPGEPGPQHALRRPQAHRPACATPPRAATRSSIDGEATR